MDSLNELRQFMQERLMYQQEYTPKLLLKEVCDNITGVPGSYQILMNTDILHSDLKIIVDEISRRCHWTPEYRQSHPERFQPMTLPDTA